MGFFKELDIRIRNGGDDAIAAAVELVGLAEDRRAYEKIMQQSEGEITDIVTVLRGLSFASMSPQADESSSLLRYCVTHAADEIEALRSGQVCWTQASERLPNAGSDDVLVAFDCGDGSHSQSIGWHNGTQWMFYTSSDVRSQWPVSHWMPLPDGPKSAFTAVEVLTVLAIIATLVALIMPAFLAARKNADHMTVPSVVESGDPPESWSLCTVKHSGHWFVVGDQWGLHHPGCPCHTKTAEAE
jgi:hypothetical protein